MSEERSLSELISDYYKSKETTIRLRRQILQTAREIVQQVIDELNANEDFLGYGVSEWLIDFLPNNEWPDSLIITVVKFRSLDNGMTVGRGKENMTMGVATIVHLQKALEEKIIIRPWKIVVV